MTRSRVSGMTSCKAKHGRVTTQRSSPSSNGRSKAIMGELDGNADGILRHPSARNPFAHFVE